MVRSLPPRARHADRINRTMTPAEWALLVTCALLWGGSYLLQRVAVNALPPLRHRRLPRDAWRARFSTSSSAPPAPACPRDPATWRAFFVMGFLNNVMPFSLIAWAQSHMASGLASILNATTPLFAVVSPISSPATRRMTPARVAGVIIGFAGVVVMIGPDALGTARRDLLAELALPARLGSYALSVVFGRRFSPRGPPAAGHGNRPDRRRGGDDGAARLFVDRPWTLPMPGAGVWAALIARRRSPPASPTSSTIASSPRPAR